jgi:PHP domain
LPRPARLLTPPEPVSAAAEIPDAPPLFFVWRKIRHRVVKADGPERILGEWWVSDADIGMQRDYYRVENASGERFWLFCDAPANEGGRWWLHGLGEAYAELQVTTHFSFLRGASSPEELFSTAALLGITALGVTDRNSLAGIVRAHEAAKVTGVNLIVGCRLDLEDFPSLLVYPTDRKAYARLCRLLTIGKGRAGKGRCQLFWKDVQEWSEGLIAILVTKDPSPELATHLHSLRSEFGDREYCGLTRRFRPNDLATLHAIAQAARLARVPAVVTGDVLYHAAEQRMLQDVVTCIRLERRSIKPVS